MDEHVDDVAHLGDGGGHIDPKNVSNKYFFGRVLPSLAVHDFEEFDDKT